MKTPKPGDIVFIKKSKADSHRSTPDHFYHGYGFALLIGEVPPFQKMPAEGDLLRLIGQAGFIRFDDISDLLGEDVGKKCVDHFTDKYWGRKKSEPVQPELPGMEPDCV